MSETKTARKKRLAREWVTPDDCKRPGDYYRAHTKDKPGPGNRMTKVMHTPRLVTPGKKWGDQ
jgi:hypothetical protein